MPNPATETATVRLHSPQNEIIRLQLLNTAGQLVKSWNRQLFKGDNILLLPLEDLNDGMFFIQMNLNGQLITLKLIKQ
jgi:hypothetical protein